MRINDEKINVLHIIIIVLRGSDRGIKFIGTDFKMIHDISCNHALFITLYNV